MENETVILDAGHGGDDYGFTLGAFKEKEAMLRITTSLEKKLQEEGIKTFKTRNDDSTLDNMTRLEIIKELSPYQNAILITNHLNPQNKETKIIYSNGLNEEILNKISQEFNKEIFKTKNSILEKKKDFYYLNRNYPNTIRIEYALGDLSNEDRDIKENLKIFTDKLLKVFKNSKEKIESTISDSFEYIVKKGDTIFNISKRFAVNKEQLQTVNNLDNNLLQLGQRLIIPKNDKYLYYKVQKGDTIFMGNNE